VTEIGHDLSGKFNLSMTSEQSPKPGGRMAAGPSSLHGLLSLFRIYRWSTPVRISGALPQNRQSINSAERVDCSKPRSTLRENGS